MDEKREKLGKIMTAQEVSDLLRIPLSTIYDLAAKGKIRGVKFGKHWRFLEEEIIRYFKGSWNLSKKVITAALLISFIVTNHANAFALADPFSPHVNADISRPNFPSDLARIQVPAEFGKIEEVFVFKGQETGDKRQATGDKVQTNPRARRLVSRSPLVILIQDAHAIPDAQRSIQQLIGHFQKEYGIGLVALEGASNPLDTQIFRSFPDREILKKVFDQYAEQGELAGGPAAAIFSAEGGSASGGQENASKYVGIEDWNLYENGIRLYQEAMAKEEALLPLLQAASDRLQIEKEKVYSPELLEIDRMLQAFHKNEVDLIQVLKMFERKRKRGQVPDKGTGNTSLPVPLSVQVLLEEIEKEGKDQSAIEREVRTIAERVRKFLELKADSPLSLRAPPAKNRTGPPFVGGKGRSNPLSEIASVASRPRNDSRLVTFNQNYQAFQTSQISAVEFALFLKKFIEKGTGSEVLNVPFSTALLRLMDNHKRLRDIKGTKLFEEFEWYAKQVKESLFKTEEEKRIDESGERLRLMEALVKLELSFDQWQEIKQMAEFVIARELLSRSNPNNEIATRPLGARDDKQWGNIFPLLETHFKFYETANARDQIFYEKLQVLMKKEKANAAVMIAGGFHARQLTKLFKENGISYALVLPKIESIPGKTNYRAQMAGNVSWKSYFETENGRVNLYQAFVRGARDRLLREALSVKREAKQDLASATDASRDTLHSSRLLKSWRDQIIRDLAAQNRIADSGQYTRFLDELGGDASRDTLSATRKDGSASYFGGHASQLVAQAYKFAAGLRKLHSAGQLNQQNIASLLKTVTTQTLVVASFDPAAFTNSYSPLGRAEVRVITTGNEMAAVVEGAKGLLTRLGSLTRRYVGRSQPEGPFRIISTTPDPVKQLLGLAEKLEKFTLDYLAGGVNLEKSGIFLGQIGFTHIEMTDWMNNNQPAAGYRHFSQDLRELKSALEILEKNLAALLRQAGISTVAPSELEANIADFSSQILEAYDTVMQNQQMPSAGPYILDLLYKAPQEKTPAINQVKFSDARTQEQVPASVLPSPPLIPKEIADQMVLQKIRRIHFSDEVLVGFVTQGEFLRALLRAVLQSPANEPYHGFEIQTQTSQDGFRHIQITYPDIEENPEDILLRSEMRSDQEILDAYRRLGFRQSSLQKAAAESEEKAVKVLNELKARYVDMLRFRLAQAKDVKLGNDIRRQAREEIVGNDLERIFSIVLIDLEKNPNGKVFQEFDSADFRLRMHNLFAILLSSSESTSKPGADIADQRSLLILQAYEKLALNRASILYRLEQGDWQAQIQRIQTAYRELVHRHHPLLRIRSALPEDWNAPRIPIETFNEALLEWIAPEVNAYLERIPGAEPFEAEEAVREVLEPIEMPVKRNIMNQLLTELQRAQTDIQLRSLNPPFFSAPHDLLKLISFLRSYLDMLLRETNDDREEPLAGDRDLRVALRVPHIWEAIERSRSPVDFSNFLAEVENRISGIRRPNHDLRIVLESIRFRSQNMAQQLKDRPNDKEIHRKAQTLFNSIDISGHFANPPQFNSIHTYALYDFFREYLEWAFLHTGPIEDQDALAIMLISDLLRTSFFTPPLPSDKTGPPPVGPLLEQIYRIFNPDLFPPESHEPNSPNSSEDHLNEFRQRIRTEVIQPLDAIHEGIVQIVNELVVEDADMDRYIQEVRSRIVGQYGQRLDVLRQRGYGIIREFFGPEAGNRLIEDIAFREVALHAMPDGSQAASALRGAFTWFLENLPNLTAQSSLLRELLHRNPPPARAEVRVKPTTKEMKERLRQLEGELKSLRQEQKDLTFKVKSEAFDEKTKAGDLAEANRRLNELRSLIGRLDVGMQLLQNAIQASTDTWQRLRLMFEAMFGGKIHNTTNFFRESDEWLPQLEEYLEIFVNDIKQNKFPKRIRAKSLGAATGQEAYSIALVIYKKIKKHFPDVEWKDWDIRIDAYDLDAKNLEWIRKGEYGGGDDYMEADSALGSAFLKTNYRIDDLMDYQKENGSYVVKDVFKKWVHAHEINLQTIGALRELSDHSTQILFARNTIKFYFKGYYQLIYWLFVRFGFWNHPGTTSFYAADGLFSNFTITGTRGEFKNQTGRARSEPPSARSELRTARDVWPSAIRSALRLEFSDKRSSPFRGSGTPLGTRRSEPPSARSELRTAQDVRPSAARSELRVRDENDPRFAGEPRERGLAQLLAGEEAGVSNRRNPAIPSRQAAGFLNRRDFNRFGFLSGFLASLGIRSASYAEHNTPSQLSEKQTAAWHKILEQNGFSKARVKSLLSRKPNATQLFLTRELAKALSRYVPESSSLYQDAAGAISKELESLVRDFIRNMDEDVKVKIPFLDAINEKYFAPAGMLLEHRTLGGEWSPILHLADRLSDIQLLMINEVPILVIYGKRADGVPTNRAGFRLGKINAAFIDKDFNKRNAETYHRAVNGQIPIKEGPLKEYLTAVISLLKKDFEGLSIEEISVKTLKSTLHNELLHAYEIATGVEQDRDYEMRSNFNQFAGSDSLFYDAANIASMTQEKLDYALQAAETLDFIYDKAKAEGLIKVDPALESKQSLADAVKEKVKNEVNYWKVLAERLNALASMNKKDGPRLVKIVEAVWENKFKSPLVAKLPTKISMPLVSQAKARMASHLQKRLEALRQSGTVEEAFFRDIRTSNYWLEKFGWQADWAEDAAQSILSPALDQATRDIFGKQNQISDQDQFQILERVRALFLKETAGIVIDEEDQETQKTPLPETKPQSGSSGLWIGVSAALGVAAAAAAGVYLLYQRRNKMIDEASVIIGILNHFKIRLEPDALGRVVDSLIQVKDRAFTENDVDAALKRGGITIGTREKNKLTQIAERLNSQFRARSEVRSREALLSIIDTVSVAFSVGLALGYLVAYIMTANVVFLKSFLFALLPLLIVMFFLYFGTETVEQKARREETNRLRKDALNEIAMILEQLTISSHSLQQKFEEFYTTLYTVKNNLDAWNQEMKESKNDDFQTHKQIGDYRMSLTRINRQLQDVIASANQTDIDWEDPHRNIVTMGQLLNDKMEIEQQILKLEDHLKDLMRFYIDLKETDKLLVNTRQWMENAAEVSALYDKLEQKVESFVTQSRVPTSKESDLRESLKRLKNQSPNVYTAPQQMEGHVETLQRALLRLTDGKQSANVLLDKYEDLLAVAFGAYEGHPLVSHLTSGMLLEIIEDMRADTVFIENSPIDESVLSNLEEYFRTGEIILRDTFRRIKASRSEVRNLKKPYRANFMGHATPRGNFANLLANLELLPLGAIIERKKKAVSGANGSAVTGEYRAREGLLDQLDHQSDPELLKRLLGDDDMANEIQAIVKRLKRKNTEWEFRVFGDIIAFIGGWNPSNKYGNLAFRNLEDDEFRTLVELRNRILRMPLRELAEKMNIKMPEAIDSSDRTEKNYFRWGFLDSYYSDDYDPVGVILPVEEYLRQGGDPVDENTEVNLTGDVFQTSQAEKHWEFKAPRIDLSKAIFVMIVHHSSAIDGEKEKIKKELKILSVPEKDINNRLQRIIFIPAEEIKTLSDAFRYLTETREGKRNLAKVRKSFERLNRGLRSELRSALTKDQKMEIIEQAYQYLYAGKFRGISAEALADIRHTEHGIFQPSTFESIRKRLELAEIVKASQTKPAEVQSTFLDPVAGDGRVAFMAAALGYKAAGFETNDLLIKAARTIRTYLIQNKVIEKGQVRFEQVDFMKEGKRTDFSRFEVIDYYDQSSNIQWLNGNAFMDKLKTMKPGTLLIVYWAIRVASSQVEDFLEEKIRKKISKEDILDTVVYQKLSRAEGFDAPPRSEARRAKNVRDVISSFSQDIFQLRGRPQPVPKSKLQLKELLWLYPSYLPFFLGLSLAIDSGKTKKLREKADFINGEKNGDDAVVPTSQEKLESQLMPASLALPDRGALLRNRSLPKTPSLFFNYQNQNNGNKNNNTSERKDLQSLEIKDKTGQIYSQKGQQGSADILPPFRRELEPPHGRYVNPNININKENIENKLLKARDELRVMSYELSKSDRDLDRADNSQLRTRNSELFFRSEIRNQDEESDADVKRAKEALSRLVLKPADYDWKAHEEELKAEGLLDLTGLPLGETGQTGQISLSPIPYFPFAWSLFGKTEAGWKARITAGRVADLGYELTVKFEKEGEKASERVFYIGKAKREIHGTNKQRTQTREVLDIVSDPESGDRKKVLSTLSKLILKPANYDWKAHEEELKAEGLLDLGGLPLGETGQAGQISLFPIPNFPFDWSLFGKKEAGWKARITAGRVTDLGYELTVKFEKEGEKVSERVFYIGPTTREIEGVNNAKGQRRKVLDLVSDESLAMQSLARLVTKPKDYDWKTHEEELKVEGLLDLAGLPLGETSRAGQIFFSPIPNFSFAWSLLGKFEAGWKARITAGRVTDSGYELTVKFEKEGEKVSERVFYIGKAKREIHGTNKQRTQTRKVLDIVSDPESGDRKKASSALSKLILKPANYDWKAHAEELKAEGLLDLVGLPLGETGQQGHISFSPIPYFVFYWSLFGKTEAGWKARITAGRVTDLGYELTVKFEKEGEKASERVFYIGKAKRKILGDRKQYGQTREVLDIRVVKYPHAVIVRGVEEKMNQIADDLESRTQGHPLSEAQRILLMIGRGLWDEIAEDYVDQMENLMPYWQHWWINSYLGWYLEKTGRKNLLEEEELTIADATLSYHAWRLIEKDPVNRKKPGKVADISERMLKAAWERLVREGIPEDQRPERIGADMLRLPIANKAFKRINNSSMRLIPKALRWKAIAEMNRVLEAEGIGTLAVEQGHVTEKFKESLEALGFAVEVHVKIELTEAQKEALREVYGPKVGAAIIEKIGNEGELLILRKGKDVQIETGEGLDFEIEKRVRGTGAGRRGEIGELEAIDLREIDKSKLPVLYKVEVEEPPVVEEKQDKAIKHLNLEELEALIYSKAGVTEAEQAGKFVLLNRVRQQMDSLQARIYDNAEISASHGQEKEIILRLQEWVRANVAAPAVGGYGYERIIVNGEQTQVNLETVVEYGLKDLINASWDEFIREQVTHKIKYPDSPLEDYPPVPFSSRSEVRIKKTENNSQLRTRNSELAFKAATVFVAVAQGKLSAEKAARRELWLIQAGGAMDIDNFIQGFIENVRVQAAKSAEKVSEEERETLRDTYEAVERAMQDMAPKIRAAYRDLGAVVAVSMSKDDISEIQVHGEAIQRLGGVGFKSVYVKGLKGDYFNTVRSELRKAGVENSQPIRSFDHIPALALNQAFVPVLFPRGTDALETKNLVLSLGIDPAGFAGLINRSETEKQILRDFSIFLIYASAPAALRALSPADVQTLNALNQRKQTQLAEGDRQKMGEIQAKLIRELRQVLAFKDIPGLENLFSAGLNLNLAVVDAIVETYRAEVRIQQAA